MFHLLYHYYIMFFIVCQPFQIIMRQKRTTHAGDALKLLTNTIEKNTVS